MSNLRLLKESNTLFLCLWWSMYSTFSVLSNLSTELAWWNVKLVLLLLFILERVYAKCQNPPILVLGSVLRANSSSWHHLPYPPVMGLSHVLPSQLRQEMLWLLLSLSRSCFSQCPLQLSLRRPLVQEGRPPCKCQHWVLFTLNPPEKSLMLHPTRTGFKHFRKPSLCRHNVISKHERGLFQSSLFSCCWWGSLLTHKPSWLCPSIVWDNRKGNSIAWTMGIAFWQPQVTLKTGNSKKTHISNPPLSPAKVLLNIYV